MILFSRRCTLSFACALVTFVTAARASAADAGDDSGITDSGVTTVPSEGGKLVDASTSSSSGDPAPAVEDDGGCTIGPSGPAGGDGSAAFAVLATAALAVVLRARRRNK